MGPFASESVPSRDRAHAPSSSFVFASQLDGFIASGVRWLAPEVDRSWTSQFRTFRARDAEGAPSILLGVLPFDHSRRPYLFQPESVRPFDNAISEASTSRIRRAGARWRAHAEPSIEAFKRNVALAHERIREAQATEGALEKVVLARSLVLTSDTAIDQADVVARLLLDRSVTVFAVPVPSEAGAAATLIGATPELLVEKRGVTVASLPLAGSSPRFADASTDRTSAERLNQSEKDRREHRAVVEWIADRLAPFCRELSVPSTPSLVSTRFMWHLGSRIAGTLRDPDVSSLELAETLHPTPAVCGRPYQAARDAIAELEQFDRGYFAGAVGWSDVAGDGQWMMTIRCAEIADRSARLYAGAGVVLGSDPAMEANETSAKFAALLDALGVNESGDSNEGTNV